MFRLYRIAQQQVPTMTQPSIALPARHAYLHSRSRAYAVFGLSRVVQGLLWVDFIYNPTLTTLSPNGHTTMR